MKEKAWNQMTGNKKASLKIRDAFSNEDRFNLHRHDFLFFHFEVLFHLG